MADFDITDGFRKVFLASVGTVATTAEKSQEVIDGFVKKGELLPGPRARPSTRSLPARRRRSLATRPTPLCAPRWRQ